MFITWGREPVTIADIKAYESKSKSLSSSQVLMKNYSAMEAEIITKEMTDQLCLDMAAQSLVTESVSLQIGYSYTYGIPDSKGTAKITSLTNAASLIIPAVAKLYSRIVNPACGIRRISLCCNNVVPCQETLQLNMFENPTKQVKCETLQAIRKVSCTASSASASFFRLLRAYASSSSYISTYSFSISRCCCAFIRNLHPLIYNLLGIYN